MALKRKSSQPAICEWWKEKESKRLKEGKKWSTLKHNGPAFAPEYEKVPRRVKFYYNGRPMSLSKEAEEVAGFYGRMLNDQYTKRKKFNDNFFEDWQEVMTQRERKKITDFRKCDFWDFFDFYEEEAEKRRQLSPEEKEEIKWENEEIMRKHGYCVVDGRKQKIGNFKVEPPGLFRGRGNHPQMGRLKMRVDPEDVTLNLGEEATVPRPPPGHRWGEVIHDDTVSWLSRWVENISGKFKYVMLNPSSQLKGRDDILKYEKARQLKRYIRKIRNVYTRNFLSEDIHLRQRAVALYFIDKLALRTGSEKHKDSADTVGCCSLRVEHIELDEYFDGEEFVVHFDFPAKDAVRFKNSVPVDDRVFDSLELFMEGKRRGDYLFDYLAPAELNRHLSSFMDGLTAKVFRTYNASKVLEQELKRRTKKSMLAEEKLMAYNDANRAVAILCNHHRSVPKTFYKSMKNLEKKIKAKIKQEKDLIKEIKRLERDHGKNSVAVQRKKRKLSMTKKQIDKLNIQVKVKEDNKDIVLTTSKLNYMDPRISVAWCKKWNVPIEKIYNKTQRERFMWAIDTTSASFKF